MRHVFERIGDYKTDRIVFSVVEWYEKQLDNDEENHFEIVRPALDEMNACLPYVSGFCCSPHVEMKDGTVRYSNTYSTTLPELIAALKKRPLSILYSITHHPIGDTRILVRGRF